MSQSETMVFAFRWDGERGSGIKDGNTWFSECRSLEELLEDQNALKDQGFTILG